MCIAGSRFIMGDQLEQSERQRDRSIDQQQKRGTEVYCRRIDRYDRQKSRQYRLSDLQKRVDGGSRHEWYIVYAVPQAVCSISRFNSFAKDVIKDPQYAKVYFVNSRMLVSYPQYYDPAEWRIKALALLSRNDYFLSRRMFDGYLKLMKHYSKDEIKSDLQTIKRAVDRNKGKMRDWEKFAAAVDKVIAKYQDK